MRPDPVKTTTVVESFSTLPSRTSRNSSASGAAEAGSANNPSLLARRIWAERISVSVTAAIVPPDSSRAEVAVPAAVDADYGAIKAELGL